MRQTLTSPSCAQAQDKHSRTLPAAGARAQPSLCLAVTAAPGAAGCRLPGPEPCLPRHVPGMRLLLPAGPRGTDQAAQHLLHHLDSSNGRARLLVSVPPHSWGQPWQAQEQESPAGACALCVAHSQLFLCPRPAPAASQLYGQVLPTKESRRVTKMPAQALRFRCLGWGRGSP